jgi:hypothetical protein
MNDDGIHDESDVFSGVLRDHFSSGLGASAHWITTDGPRRSEHPQAAF